MEKELNRWYRKLWETKGCRFIAAKRYDRLDRYSTITIHIMSAYLLCANLIILLPNRHPILSNENLNFFSICASIILLVVSLHIPSRKYNELSHKFHSCAREINLLYDKVCYWKNNIDIVENKDILKLINDYNLILHNYDINHSKYDYHIFKIENSTEYKFNFKFFFSIKTYFANFFMYYLIYFLALICPIAIFVILMNI
ncbi:MULTISPECIES: SLATT domain-containing protein [Chryseobacterium]|uniref:SMODS and SLOG-associating 2TM effector domain-containing protein n=1 Tax=Chryseobacterium camelliae TaxID=1265445 RepID=A0ABU0TIL2_9FLAO|nr:MULTISPECIES: SLATT domain-containing protein [Chryseobacterium]MDT3409254.1 hypothetical protein [Pseudacidovorax intermedius]MDQ1096883.1 hypothetical protein [Chryseobacterium camelliae]MDQ1100825.1 hypothetical protein [Chryseobacterium sp. SORGH_AS_1048]MDR6084266.1 hypothetical protein [Chryseobacterium sp. SORGH_AS_0909]MDR6132539.1 hypothetical protein [Chryseobacterium sp. SORGH_AS_1175]